MNCWEILGIESNVDKKAIKIAYSKLLKITRPDDDPDGFERLHSAYKTALNSVGGSNVAPAKEHDLVFNGLTPVDKIDADHSAIPIRPLENTLEHELSRDPDKAVQDKLASELDNELSHFASLVTEIMKNKSSANSLNSWESVVKSPLVTDLQYKDIAGDHVFDIISQKNVLSDEGDMLYIEPNTLNHLNAYFSWNSNWAQLEAKFGRSRLDAVVPFLDAEEEFEVPQEARPHIFSRIVGHITSLLAIIAGYLHLNLLAVIILIAIPVTINRVYKRKWQTKHYGRVIGGEDKSIENNKYILYPTLFTAMCFVVLLGYGVGWGIHYLINLILA